MRSNACVILVILAVVLLFSAHASEYFTTINIDVKEEWFNSGLYVNVGDTLYLTGFGAFSAWASGNVWYNMSSTGPFLGNQNFVAPGYPAPAIIGRIGTSAKFVVAGTVAFVSTWSGPLYFTVNDQAGGYADNRGTVIVWARIRPHVTAGETLPPSDEQLRLGQNLPNPFAEETRIAFEVPSASRVRVAIFDDAGRQVRVLLEQPMEPGTHAVVWDGRDGQGSRMPSGVYFYRVDLGTASGARQMVLLR